MTFRSVAVSLLLVSLLGAPAFAQLTRLSFFNMVALGDSLAAGFISGGWNLTGQNNSFVAHFARHVGTFVFQPLIPEPGLPAELQLVSPGFPPVVAPKPGATTGRVSPLIIPTNLAVPGATLASALRQRPALPIDAPIDFVLGIPSLVIPNSSPVLSQVEMAEFLRPSVALVWLGNNDALGAATSGGRLELLTDVGRFASDYREMLSRLRAAGANLIVLNIPDVTAIAAVMSVNTAAALANIPPAFVVSRLGISPTDYLLLSQVNAYVAKFLGQETAPLTDAQVLTAEEAAAIRQRITEFNDVIRTAAAENRAVLVDIHAAFNQIAANGLLVGAKRLTTLPLGGVFSLDGVHPTYTAQAWVANEIVTALNRTLGLGLPPVNVAAVMAADPLVF
jgi:lysophospholipase L1-like esterase